MRRRRLFLCFFFMCIFAAAQNADKQPPSAPPEKLGNLIVYGKGFAFAVKEPAGWGGDTDSAAALGANIVFRPKTAPNRSNIRIRINKKVDENTVEDLRADMKGYQQKYPGVTFQNLPVQHPQYSSYARLFFVKGQFYEYVAYLNPGAGKSVIFSVAMSKANSAATAQELDAFRQVISSLVLLEVK